MLWSAVQLQGVPQVHDIVGALRQYLSWLEMRALDGFMERLWPGGEKGHSPSGTIGNRWRTPGARMRVNEHGNFCQTFSDVLREHKMTLTSLAAELAERGHKVSVATLSYWQTGRSVPSRPASLAALAQIEQILGLPDRMLFEALPSKERGALSSAQLLPGEEAVAVGMRQLGLDMEPRHANLSLHDQITIGDDRCVHGHVVRQVLRADVEGLLEWPVIYRQVGAEQGAPHVAAVRGAVLDRFTVVQPDGIFIGALRIPRRVERGELVYVEYRIDWQPTRKDQLQRAVPELVRMLVLDVEFTGALPTSVRYGSRERHDAPQPDPQWDVPIVGRSAQQAVLNASAGLHGLVWAWD